MAGAMISPSAPSEATTSRSGVSDSWRRIRFWVIGSSSMSRTTAASAIEVSSTSPRLSRGAGRRTVNVEPTPGSESTSRSPPIIRHSWREIVSPSPVPPYSRLVEASA